jgi:hypothetical protein
VKINIDSAQRTAGVSGITCTGGCANVHITNNIIQGNYGVMISGATASFIEGNTITAYGENAGSNISGAGVAVQGTTTDTYGYNCGGSTGNLVHVKNNIIYGASNGTTAGIIFCNHNYGEIAGNSLNGPGYFGITARGPNVTSLTIQSNRVYNPVHEAIIVGEGANLVQVSGNSLLFGASSIDYGITVDGTQGVVTHVTVTGNILQACYNSCIVFASPSSGGGVQFSSIVGNAIVNANQHNLAGEAGINVYGGTTRYNTISGNSVTNTSVRAGYLIHEHGGGVGMPSHNVYMNNSGFNMSTGDYSIGVSSTSNNNIGFP